MKIYHFVLLFFLFFIVAVLKLDIDTGKLKSIENEKTELNISLDTATTDTIHYLAKTGAYGTNSINKREVVNTFLISLYTSLGIISDTAAQEEMEMYIPVILLCDTDGYYVYYYDEYNAADGYTYTKRKWSEKMPYYYKDSDFIYRFTLTDMVYLYDVNHLLSSDSETLELDYHEIQKESDYETFRNKHSDCILLHDEAYEIAKKGAITRQLEDVIAYYTSRHNKIAQKNGITYTFSFPSGDKGKWANYMDDVNLLVVFQGYPYGADRNYSYNKIACAGANVMKKGLYFVEKKGWYYLAHKEGCPKLQESTTVLEETFESLEECAKIGAYCCDECIEYGARAPNLK